MSSKCTMWKALVLSMILTGSAPSAMQAVTSSDAVAQSDAEDMEAARERLMNDYYIMMTILKDIYSELEASEGVDISRNNTRLLKEAVLQKATELKSLGDIQLEADMQAIIDAVENSRNESNDKDDLTREVESLAGKLENTRYRLEMASTMEELANLQAEMDNLRMYTQEIEKEVKEWISQNGNNENAFNTKNVSGYYEKMWQYAKVLNYPLFKSGDLFIAKGLIFKVLDVEKKTCQLGRGEGNWWPEDLLAAEELANSECYERIQLDQWNYGGKFTLPDQVLGFTLTVVGNAAFNQQHLNMVVLNESLEEIGNDAFETYGLREIFLPKNVKKIGKLAFSRLRANMQRFEVDTQNPYFMHTADYKGVVETTTNTLVAACEDIEIPEYITTIGEGVFYDCRFETKALPENLQTIGQQAFQYCENMKSITLPDNLKEIAQWAFIYAGLTEISLPVSITNIGSEAFKGCEHLATIQANWLQPIEIPEDVFCLEHYEESPVWGFVTDNTIYEQAALYVPKGLREVYAATPGWSKFQKILEEGEIDLNPFEGNEQETTPENVKDVEDLSGVVINDIYYSMDTDNGDGYDETTNSLVFNSTLSETDESELDNTPALPEDFYGICFQVPAGSGRVTIDVETAGSRTVGVKVGSQPAKRFAPDDHQQIVVEYSVYSTTYIYVYPSNKPALARRNAATVGDDCVRIFGIKWEKLSEATAIRQMDVQTGNPQYYNLNGQRIASPSKGLYIVNGRKVVK